MNDDKLFFKKLLLLILDQCVRFNRNKNITYLTEVRTILTLFRDCCWLDLDIFKIKVASYKRNPMPSEVFNKVGLKVKSVSSFISNFVTSQKH